MTASFTCERPSGMTQERDFYIERGALINGTPDTIKSSWFYATKTTFDGKFLSVEGHIIDSNYRTSITALNDYDTAIKNALGFTSITYEGTPAWKSYTFLPKTALINNAQQIEKLILQKYLLFLRENDQTLTENQTLAMFCAADSRAQDYTITDQLFKYTYGYITKDFIWKDETEAIHTTGIGEKSLHNLGYLESTDSPPTLTTISAKPGSKAVVPIHLKYQRGDYVTINPSASNIQKWTGRIDVIEILDTEKEPAWYNEIIPLIYFNGSEGGTPPAGDVQYIGLNTNNFSNVLDSSVSNLQAFADAVDDHDHSGLATTEGIQDIIGAMVSGNTETGITVTYDDTDGTIDFVVSNQTAAQVGAVPKDGWIATSVAVTSGTLDSPSFELSFAADMTALIGLGFRIKLTQSTTKYFLVTKVGAFSSGATVITCYGGTDYTLVASGTTPISNVYYSNVKAPFGFPMDPAKWTVSLSNTSRCQKLTPTASTWYGDTGLSATGPSVSVPIGAWRGYMKAVLQTSDTTVTDYNCYMTLSTASNSESDNDNTIFVAITVPSGTYKLFNIGAVSIKILVTSKTTYYMNIKTSTSTADAIEIRGDVVPTILKLVSDYL